MRNYQLVLCVVFLFSIGCQKENTHSDNEPHNLISTGENIDSQQLNQAKEIITVADPFLRKYKGLIDNKHEIDLILTNLGNGQLEGYYSYTKVGEKIELFGEINLDESFTMTELSGSEITGSFKGSLSNTDVISGTWMNSDSTRRLPFTLEAVNNTDDPIGWTGSWHLNGIYDGGVLIIGNVNNSTFDFHLTIVRNAHHGLVSGTASYSGNKATFDQQVIEEEDNCLINFHYQKDSITLKQNSSNLPCGFGARAYVDGAYQNEKAIIKPKLFYEDNTGVFSSKDRHDVFKTYVGEELYDLFAFNMQITDEYKVMDEENEIAGMAVVGAVQGLYSICEAIIVQNEKYFWAATIDSPDNDENPFFRYVTNDPTAKNKIPNPIKEWMSRLPDYEVRFENRG